MKKAVTILGGFLVLGTAAGAIALALWAALKGETLIPTQSAHKPGGSSTGRGPIL